jgi:hypothetical protein
MNNHWNVLSRSLYACALLVAFARPAGAQTITTGNIAGTVEDQQGGRVPGAAIQAVHTETGTVYQTLSLSDGRFSILSVRVGGYTMKATMAGFRAREIKDVVVNLGEERSVSFKLELERVAESVTVTAEAPPIDLANAGTAGHISNAVKENAPTIARSLTDIVRTNVYFNPMGVNEDIPFPAIAGRSQRYNSLQIDGAANNDLFGLAAGGGVPGGVTGSQPISLDAIQEIQLVVSPYDIRQSGFSGGGINAITKTGTNQYRGTAFIFGRNEDWVGKGVTRQPISTFKDLQSGFTFGGPISRDRAFFFVAVDEGRRTQPSGFSVGGTGVDWGNEALVDRFIDSLSTLYGHDLGPNAKDEFIREANSDKVFLRGDFNLGSHQFTIRHNFVHGRNDTGTLTATLFVMPDALPRQVSRTHSTVGQLTSRFGQAVNELRVAATRVRDKRLPQPGFEDAPFPSITVTLFGSTQVRAGRDAFSAANELDQTIVEVTDDYTRIMGRHQITVGTHNEFFEFRNLFIRDFFGSYTFNSLDLFEQGLAQGFSHSFSATADPLQAAQFKVRHFGFYAGDVWRFNARTTITGGVRADIVRYPIIPNANPAAVDNFGFRTDVVPNNTLFSPRVGINYALRADGSEQIRGGVGLFAGRTPYVWVSNQYGNTGIDFTRLSLSTSSSRRFPFVSDPFDQPTSISGVGAATNEIDVIDPDFKYPSILRGNLAYDRKLPWLGLYATGEVLFTSVVNDIRFEHLNLRQIATSSIDGRPVFARNVVPTLGDVILLTNTDQGHTWSVALEVKRPLQNGLFVTGSYLYGRSYSIADGVRDQAVSAWGNVYTTGDPNNPTLGRSDYDPGHRVNLTTTYNFKLFKSYRMTASVFYSGQSGRPYTLLWGAGASTGSVNGDTQTLNDILFLPESGEGLVFTNGTYEDLRRYLDSHECTRRQIGTIMQRNSCRSPAIQTLDMRLAFHVPAGRAQAEITFDLLNVLNFIDHNRGQFRYANFNDIIPVSATASAGVVTGMNLATLNSASFTEFVRSDLRSRWQLQIGARIRY